MKLVLNSLFLCLFFICAPAFGDNIYKKYKLTVSGIKIGVLDWKVNITNTHYFNEINLKSEGVLSGIYSFEGRYFSEGVVKNNKLRPTKYTHYWKTNKTTKEMELVFQDNKLTSLNQKPIEKEHLRINVFNIEKNKDPLTSFLQIILGEKKSLVVDGRRTYTMSAAFNNKESQTVIGISNYNNLWADHKRSEFEKIIFERKNGGGLPNKINIYFDGRVFKLEQI